MKFLAPLAFSSFLFMSVEAKYAVYKTTITPIPGVDSQVSGSVVVFADTEDMTTVGYGGHVTGLEPGLLASDCPATNGCGVHIHSGMACENSTVQGGHYFADPVMSDPWISPHQYSSDSDGMTMFGSFLEMGTIDLDGRAFVVHAEDGSRVGCGLLEKVEDYLTADLAPLGDASAMGSVTALPVEGTDMICYMGYGSNLEPELSAFYAAEEGPNCTATNGCGTHVHAGTSCESTQTQMGHYYTGDSDPWAIVGYDSTSADGSATFMDCVSTPGATEFDGKAFILHSNGGGRMACGLLVMPSMGAPSFPEEVAATGDYSTLISLIDGDEMLQGVIASAGPITVFGPNDAAFAAIADVVAGLSVEEVRATLGNHVVSGVYTAAMVKEAGCVMLTPLAGEPIRVMWVEVSERKLAGHSMGVTGHVMINDAMVVDADIGGRRLAGHGVASIFHGLDAVILPGNFSCPDMESDAPVAAPTAAESSASFSGLCVVLAAILALSGFAF